MAVLGGLAVQPSLLGRDAEPRMAPAGDSYEGYDAKAAERLREDQCLAGEAMRRGGPSMFALAQEAIALPPDQLHEKLERDIFNDKTPLHQAYRADSDSKDQWVDKVQKQGYAWSSATSGLESYPGEPRDANKIYDRIGLLPWLWQSYSNPEEGVLNPFWDPSPTADDKTKAAALAIGDPLYTTGGTPKEQEAWALWKKNSGKVEPNEFFVPRVFADDARIFLASGGFPRTAPAPGTPEFRVAVEDLKTRFASCAWHDPIDPNRVLGKEVAQASAEWQQEIASQAAQRQQILAAGKDATKALQDGTFTLGQIVGQSWLADYYTRWQDYWSPGGVGWIGDSHVTIEVPGARGSCLDVQGGGTTNGTPVQIYTCNGGAAQQWTLEGSEDDLHLRNVGSQKCLDVAGNASANGTKIQISDCYKSKGQSWKGDVRATSPLKSLSTGKCLDLSSFAKSTDARLWDCKDAGTQKLRREVYYVDHVDDFGLSGLTEKVCSRSMLRLDEPTVLALAQHAAAEEEDDQLGTDVQLLMNSPLLAEDIHALWLAGVRRCFDPVEDGTDMRAWLWRLEDARSTRPRERDPVEVRVLDKVRPVVSEGELRETVATEISFAAAGLEQAVAVPGIAAALAECVRHCTPDLAFRLLLQVLPTKSASLSPEYLYLSAEQYARLEALGAAFRYGAYVVSDITYLVGP
ncbi:RICIN domain-containing protein [Streptomyces sp. 5K101]|uniref:RICIN domain-containing protein n=1 Tax=Streptomyces sp. 5K101 TaxID=3390037 RepID=UPI003974F0DB